MKIGITGAHGTGKTTLAKTLASKLHLPLIHETARTAAKEMGVETCDELLSNPYLAADLQWKILSLQYDKEAEHTSFITDRIYLDFLAYWYLYNCPPFTLPFVTDTFSQLCVRYSDAYDHIIYVPVEIPYDTTDKFRLSDSQTQTKFDNLLRGLSPLQLFNFIEVTGTVEERVDQVLNHEGILATLESDK